MFNKFIQDFAAWLLRWLIENVGVTPQVYSPATDEHPKPEVTPRTQRDEIPLFKYIHPLTLAVSQCGFCKHRIFSKLQN